MRIGLSPAVVAMVAALLVSPALAQAPQPVTIPSYDNVRNLDDYASRADYEAAARDRRFAFERIAYPSDGLTVYAYVYRPRDSTERLPVIVFNRGSWIRPDFSAEILTMANRLAQKNYLVVAPMYRGSGGAAGRDEMGGADLNDLMNLVPAIRALPQADADRIYLYGESRGGMMVYQALRDGFPARAAAVVGAFSDLDGMLADPQWQGAAQAIWPELDEQRSAIVTRRSAVRWADKISRPLLIVHGAQDGAVPVKQSLDLAAKLSAAGKPYQLLVVAGEGHVIAGRPADRDTWVLDWFARY